MQLSDDPMDLQQLTMVMSTIAILQHNDLLQVVLMLDKLQEKIKASRARQWVLESCRVLLGCFAGTGQAPGRAVSNSPVG